VSAKLVQLLSQVSHSVLNTVSQSANVEASLVALSENALSSIDRKAIQVIVEESRKSGFLFTQGVAAGLLARGVSNGIKLVASAPFAIDERQTAGVIAELIGGSERQVFICSYVLVYLDELLPLFVAARNRGVQIRILLDKGAGQTKSGSTTVIKLCRSIGTGCLRFWESEAGSNGSLHAKFLIADDIGLVTSANMTGRAITQNVEVGCLIEDGDILRRLASFFELLWKDGNPESVS
jgi:phosphatidylserine/phosphatidylglycerophosphate/cardiolipin synthase-like enzyme